METITLFLICRLFIGDLAGPDMIYLLEFFRVQLGVSVLVGLVFVPKVRASVKRSSHNDLLVRVPFGSYLLCRAIFPLKASG